MNFFRLALSRVLWWYQQRGLPPYHRGLAGGRHIDWWPWTCDDCGYIGPLRWFVHGYRGHGLDDLNLEDCCPRCSSDQTLPWEYARRIEHMETVARQRNRRIEIEGGHYDYFQAENEWRFVPKEQK